MPCLYIREHTMHHLRDGVRFEVVLIGLYSAIFTRDVLLNFYSSHLREVSDPGLILPQQIRA